MPLKSYTLDTQGTKGWIPPQFIDPNIGLLIREILIESNYAIL